MSSLTGLSMHPVWTSFFNLIMCLWRIVGGCLNIRCHVLLMPLTPLRLGLLLKIIRHFFERLHRRAYFAEEDTGSLNILPIPPPLKMGSPCMPGLSEISSSQPKIHKGNGLKGFAESTISTDLATTDTAMKLFTYAHSVEETTLPLHVHEHVCAFKMGESAPEPRRRPPPKMLRYPDLATHVHPQPLTSTSSPQDIELFERVIHLYNSKAFERLLLKHDLSSFCPHLVLNLQQGFPLGTLPVLADSVVIRNHPSVAEFPEVIQEYLNDEITAYQMSGLFSLSHTEHILRGPIYSSPLIVAVQRPGLSLPTKYRVCRNLSKDDPLTGIFSVNSFIDKGDFPTCFDIAHLVAEQVSLLY